MNFNSHPLICFNIFKLVHQFLPSSLFRLPFKPTMRWVFNADPFQSQFFIKLPFFDSSPASTVKALYLISSFDKKTPRYCNKVLMCEGNNRRGKISSAGRIASHFIHCQQVIKNKSLILKRSKNRSFGSNEWFLTQPVCLENLVLNHKCWWNNESWVDVKKGDLMTVLLCNLSKEIYIILPALWSTGAP